MRRKNFILLFAAIFAMLALLSACRTDYRAEAAEDAREYALKHTRELSETDRNYIRYNDPVIYSDLLFPSAVPTVSKIGGGPSRFESYGVERNPELDQMHTAFVWHLPKAGFSVVVDGTGERKLRGWSPDIVIYKKFVPENTAFSAAHIRAIEFFSNFFPDMKLAEINCVRFVEPRVLATSFVFATEEEENRETQVQKWMEYIRSGKGLEKTPTQISLVWAGVRKDEFFVVCGQAPEENLKGWLPKKAYIVAAELEEVVLKDKNIPVEDPTNELGERLETPAIYERKVIDASTEDFPGILHD